MRLKLVNSENQAQPKIDQTFSELGFTEQYITHWVFDQSYCHNYSMLIIQ